MALNFPNVSILGLSQDSRFFDAGFHYSSTKNISIEGLVLDLINSFGITGIWTGQEGIVNIVRNNQNYQDLLLNGYSFGSGRILSISFDEGIDVRTKNYRASLSILDSGNLYNLTGFFYSGVDISNFRYLDVFSENYSFEKKPNGGYAYDHDLSVRFTSGVGNLNAINAAQLLAKSLFTGSNLGLAFYSGYTNTQGKRYFNETYNLIDNSCGFQETFEFDSYNTTYSVTRTNSLEFDSLGVATTSEQGTIKGIQNPNYQKALSAVNTELTGSYYRCSQLVNNYITGTTALSNSPILQGRVIDIFSNNISYNVAFSNKPNNFSNYFWDYTQQISQQNGVGTISENGTIIGRGENRTIAFNNALLGFNTVSAGIAGRITALFISNFSSPTNYQNSKQKSVSPYQGSIGYNYQYSNDPNLIANIGIRSKNVTVDSILPIYSYNKINIFNKKEIVQNDKQSTVGDTNISVTLQGDKTVNISSFLSAALAEVNSRIPVGNDKYVGGVEYSYAPNDNELRASVIWRYNKTAIPTIQP